MNYIGKKGDTTESIARITYGSEFKAALIRRANPGVLFPLRGGESIITPLTPEVFAGNALTQNEEVAVIIDGERFSFWNKITINRSMDSIGTVAMMASFDPLNSDFRKVFVPFSYKSIIVMAGGNVIFTGIIMNIIPKKTENSRTVEINAYSLPGVLNDCCHGEGQEFNGVGIESITASLLEPFNVEFKFRDPSGDVFPLLAIEPEDKVLSFLVDLGKQRKLMITDDAQGTLIFYKPQDVAPSTVLTEGESPLVSVEPVFNAQEYYSHITGIMAKSIPSDGNFDPFANLENPDAGAGPDPFGGDAATFGGKGLNIGAKLTMKNEYLKGVYRPFAFRVQASPMGGLSEAVRSKKSRMIAGAISYTLEVDTWLDGTGKIWCPYTTLSLLAPGAMIYRQSNFHIKNVRLTKEGNQQRATLTLAVHGAFGGYMSEKMPWEE